MTANAVDTETPAPTPPGAWLTILGVVVAVLGPAAGFLGGSITGGATGDNPTRLGLWLLGGMVVGGIGVLGAFIGGLRWWRASHP